MILDTTYLLDLLKNDPGAAAKARELEEGEEPLFTTSLSVYELFQGLPFRNPAERERTKRLLDSLGLLTLDFEAAARAGEVQAELRKAGRAIEPPDALIAGIALRHGQVILTRDAAHFGRVRGLRVEGY